LPSGIVIVSIATNWPPRKMVFSPLRERGKQVQVAHSLSRLALPLSLSLCHSLLQLRGLRTPIGFYGPGFNARMLEPRFNTLWLAVVGASLDFRAPLARSLRFSNSQHTGYFSARYTLARVRVRACVCVCVGVNVKRNFCTAFFV